MEPAVLLRIQQTYPLPSRLLFPPFPLRLPGVRPVAHHRLIPYPRMVHLLHPLMDTDRGTLLLRSVHHALVIAAKYYRVTNVAERVCDARTVAPA